MNNLVDNARILDLEEQLREARRALEEARRSMDSRGEETKEFVKEAFRDWLDEQALAFGKFSLRWLIRVVMGAVLYFAVTHSNWKVSGLP